MRRAGCVVGVATSVAAALWVVASHLATASEAGQPGRPGQPSQAARPAPAAGASAGAGAAAAAKGGPGSLAGIWTVLGYKGSMFFPPRERVARTAEGEWPPLNAKWAAVFEKRVADSEQGEPFATTLTECLPGGVPEMVFGSPYPVQILETPGQVTLLYEMFNHFRIIHVGGTHPADPDPSYMGHSVGHWEGDTLVVDTMGLTERTSVDEIGIPHSEALHVIERYRRMDAANIEVMLTIDDPQVFTRRWNAKVTYRAARPGAGLIEYICENGRSLE